MNISRNISRVLAAAVASSGLAVLPTPAFGTALSCAGGSFSVAPDGNGNFNVNCTTPGGTAACSLTASTTSLPAAGGSVTLTASNCGTVTSWAKNGTQVSQSGSSWSETLPANTTSSSVSYRFTVTGSTGAADTATVTVAAAGGTTQPPPVDNGPISCAGFSSTLVYDLPWQSQSKITTKGFNNSTMVVARFRTPATSVQSASANVASAEYLPPNVLRTASISTSPCDLKGSGTGAISPGVTQQPSWTYQILGTTSRLSGKVILQPSTTYYVNIANRDSNGSPTCWASTCEMIVQLTLPTGL